MVKRIGRKEVFICTIAAFVIIIDQVTKVIIEKSISLDYSVPIIGNFFTLTYIHNFGAGFGILQGKRWLFVFLAFILLGIVGYYARRIPEKDKLIQISIGLIVGGAVGNLIDRIILGYVIDFINFSFWPAFNIADCALSCGAVVLFAWALKHKR